MDFHTYGKLLIECNTSGATSSCAWFFEDGMGFGDEEIWWPSRWEKRPNPHEGLDLVHFKNGSLTHGLFSGFRVIAPVSGVVVGLCADFLDETIWIQSAEEPQKLVLLCHVKSTVTVGESVICGDPVGAISYPVKNVPLHLHLSVLDGPWQQIQEFSWVAVHLQNEVGFMYPEF